MTETITFCEGCGKEIDPEVCHCGDLMIDHIVYDGHYLVPMGCICGYVKLSDIFPLMIIENIMTQSIHIKDEWIWRMDYLKMRGLPAAVPELWERSKKAYLIYKKEKEAEIELMNFIGQFYDESLLLNK